MSQALAYPQYQYGPRYLDVSVQNHFASDLGEFKRHNPKIRIPEQLALISKIKYSVLVKMEEDRKTKLKLGKAIRTPEQEAFFSANLAKAEEFEDAGWSYDAFRTYQAIGDHVPLSQNEAKQIEARLTKDAENPAGKNFHGFWISRILTNDGPGWNYEFEAIGDRTAWPYENLGPTRFMMTVNWSEMAQHQALEPGHGSGAGDEHQESRRKDRGGRVWRASFWRSRLEAVW